MKPAPQAGILNRPPDHALIAAYTLMSSDPVAVRDTLDARLRGILHKELRSDLDDTTPASPKDQPSAETGELGFTDRYDRYHLTVTVGFGVAAYEKLGVPAANRPQDLIPIPWTDLADSPTATTENGDVVIQVCSDSVFICEHVLRRVGEELADVLAPIWVQAGQQRHTSRTGRTSRNEGRALIGFLDGTSNLRPRTNPDDAALVFVNPDEAKYPPRMPDIPAGQPSPYGGPTPPQFPDTLREPPTREPAWTNGGTYMVVRSSVIDMRTWDRRPLGDQERAVGRFKVSGQPLGVADDPRGEIAEPDFASDPGGGVTPLNAHIRKANPRGPGDQERRIFRRGYPLVLAPGAGGLNLGLLFVCFARTISTQFEFITRAWTTNPNFPVPGAGTDPIHDIETTLCGGYFFVPPLTRTRDPWSYQLPDSA